MKEDKQHYSPTKTIYEINDGEKLKKVAEQRKEETRERVKTLAKTLEKIGKEGTPFNLGKICNRAGVCRTSVSNKQAYNKIRKEIMNHPNYRKYL